MSLWKRLVDVARAEVLDRLAELEGKHGIERDGPSANSYGDWRDHYQKYQQEEASASSQGPTGLEAEYYANLELAPGAGFADIKAAYRRLVKLYHPDRHHNDPAKAEAARHVTQKLNDAYEYFKKKYAK